jgi:Na+-transporting methylmalonyl-CoA/oxaloacetate decarboxylase gamma subunit
MQFQFDLQNILDNEGLAISITGMAIVFLGLVLVSLMIFALPKVLGWLDTTRRRYRRPAEAPDTARVSEEDAREKAIVAAIAMVLEHEMRPEDGSAVQRITIRRSGSESIWRQAGQMRSLSSRQSMRKGSR